jgi:hypothetical protein
VTRNPPCREVAETVSIVGVSSLTGPKEMDGPRLIVEHQAFATVRAHGDPAERHSASP